MQVRLFKALLTWAVAARVAHAALWDANFTALCETVIRDRKAGNSSLENSTSVCGQEYAKGKLAADYVTTDLDTCFRLNPGWESSKADKPSQWAGPLVGFLLPSLAFVISIPRPCHIPLPTKKIAGNKISAFIWGLLALVLLFVDTWLSVGLVFGFASAWIAGAIHELYVDRAILKELKTKIDSGEGLDHEDRFVLAITLVGSFDDREGTSPASPPSTGTHLPFSDSVKDLTEHADDARGFLKQACTHLVPFDVQVGVPTVFYVGAFTYSIVDALARWGDNDTAHSIAFGLWYSNILLVALASSTVLSVSNPSIIESAMATKNVTEQTLQLKWLCDRRSALAKLSEQQFLDDNGMPCSLPKRYLKILTLTYANRSALIAIVIQAPPWSLAIWVSYTTPEVGLSCRSATVLVYAVCQVLLVFAWRGRSTRKRRCGFVISVAYYLLGVAAFLCSFGGTAMQLAGIYRNCICKAGILWGLQSRESWIRANVELATDTQKHHDAASNWIIGGGVGIIWVTILCLFAAWYRVRLREMCRALIEDLRSKERCSGSCRNSTVTSRLSYNPPQGTIGLNLV
jgi:hypothetical protein